MILQSFRLFKRVQKLTFYRFESSASNDIRNIGILAHIDAGNAKTFFLEIMIDCDTRS